MGVGGDVEAGLMISSTDFGNIFGAKIEQNPETRDPIEN
jgi:hypothetical protein